MVRTPTLLVACEESQRVCTAFRERGWEAYSCDLVECSGGHPEWHIQDDCIPLLTNLGEFVTEDGHTHTHTQPWDLVIAHPPCTFVSNAGACRLYPQKGTIDYQRLADGLRAKEMFMRFYLYGLYKCGAICIENPMPSKAFDYPMQSQVIQPHQFGDPWSKKTYLWTFGLPPLLPTEFSEYKPYISCGTSANKGNKEKSGASRSGGSSKSRSKSFSGICKAMADQFGQFIENKISIEY